MVASRETAAEEGVAFRAVAGVVSNPAGHPRGQWMESAAQQQGLVAGVQLLECLKQTNTDTPSEITGWWERTKETAFSSSQKQAL